MALLKVHFKICLLTGLGCPLFLKNIYLFDGEREGAQAGTVAGEVRSREPATHFNTRTLGDQDPSQRQMLNRLGHQATPPTPHQPLSVEMLTNSSGRFPSHPYLAVPPGFP